MGSSNMATKTPDSPPAAAEGVAEAPAKPGKKKRILIIAVVVLLVLVGAAVGGLVWWQKHKAAQAEEEEGAAEAAVQHDPDAVPVFVPLDSFTVNLADTDGDRYATVKMVLQLRDAEMEKSIKSYMPAIKDTILMILSHKTSAELKSLEGKQALAEEIRREAVRPMGINISKPDPHKTEAASDASDAEHKAAAKKGSAADAINPILKVNFVEFIIQ